MDFSDSDMDDDYSEVSEESFEPQSKQIIGKGLKNAKGSLILGDNQNIANVESGGKDKKTIEQTYQKKTQLEHILLRPDTYIGSVQRVKQAMFVLENERIVQKEITFTPGLYKIFDEIVVNAADNKQRDINMDQLQIEVDPTNNLVSVKNNGKGIPIVMHKEHKCYVPTLIFGHLLTGSNFDDNEKKTTGGRNGYGAKLANIFSLEFTVEVVDAENSLKLKQTWSQNMSEVGKPIVKKCSAAEKKRGDYTKISFKPDLARFGMSTLDEDTVGLFSKRAYDLAGSMTSRAGKKISVTLNGKKLPVKSFQDYLKLFDGINPPAAYEKICDRWEVGISVSDGSAQQISFVNSICTSKGGGHVNYVTDQVTAHLIKTISKKNKGGAEVKANQIKNHLCIFVNCLIENPTFDSQTKEFLTSRPKTFGSDCKLSDKFLKLVDKSSVVESILAFAKFKQNEALKKKGGVKRIKLTGITKLDDANNAGSAKSKDCTLIVTEGDSAKSLAMSGLSVVGRDYYGVFPLRGKPLNVRDATHAQIMKNEEIKNMVDILGLKFGVTYDESNIKTLRYGHLMIMADQDHDGSHIKGLIINFIHHFWPSLMDVPGFLQQFITPIVKASRKKEVHTFYTLPQYDSWRESMLQNTKGYNIKYYKGLGTSTSAEAKEYFANLDKHEIHFSGLSDDKKAKVQESKSPMEEMDLDDVIMPDRHVSGSDMIDMVFRKSRVEDRKEWLNKFTKDTYLDYSAVHREGVKYSDFINKEFILFSTSDNQRSIPHVMDGFKPSQRKVLFSCFKRKLKSEVKVAQLAGYIGEHSAYHHGEASLHGTIINMAQTFCGSNNVNLLTPAGQFGTRRMGGKDAASPRYIFTKLESITRTIFHPDDDDLLNYLSDDGIDIEPEYYMPVIPLILVNGSEGIGTGWSSSIPNFCPRELIDNLRRMIAGEPSVAMHPKYYGFTGEMSKETGKRSYAVKGRIERIDDKTLSITELPIKKWTQDYKVFLEGMFNGDSKKAPEIKDFKENHTDTTVAFTITADKEKIDSFEREKGGLYSKFKLTASLSTANMNLFNDEGRIVKFNAPEEILNLFFHKRLDFYVKRKQLLVEKLEREQKILANKARFVEEVCSGELLVSNRKRAELLRDLEERGYECFYNDKKKNEGGEEEEDENEDTDGSPGTNLAKGYEYLLGMKIWSLTFEKAQALRKELAEKTQLLAELKATDPSRIWLNDLDAIELALDQRDRDMEATAQDEKDAQTKNTKRVSKKKVVAKKRGKKKVDDDMDVEDSDDAEYKSSTVSKGKGKANQSKPRKLKQSKIPAKKAIKVLQEKETNALTPSITISTLQQPAEIISLVEDDVADELKRKLVVSPPLKGRGKKRASPRENEDEETDKENQAAGNEIRKRVKPAQVTKGGRGRARKQSYDSDDDEEASLSGSDIEIVQPKVVRSRRTRTAPVYSFDNSESEDSESE